MLNNLKGKGFNSFISIGEEAVAMEEVSKVEGIMVVKKQEPPLQR